jgi:hypothetical protein
MVAVAFARSVYKQQPNYTGSQSLTNRLQFFKSSNFAGRVCDVKHLERN